MNSKYYLEVFKGLWGKILRVYPHYTEAESWPLLHDNAPAHKALIIRKFLASKNIVVLNHLSYSPDIAFCDYFLYPKFKSKLKGRLFDDIKFIQKASTAAFDMVMKEFSRCFGNLYGRCKQCIKAKESISNNEGESY